MQADYVVTSGSNYRKTSWGLWLDQFNRYYPEAACGALKQDRVAPAFSENFDGPSVTPEPGEFDPSKPMPTRGQLPRLKLAGVTNPTPNHGRDGRRLSSSGAPRRKMTR